MIGIFAEHDAKEFGSYLEEYFRKKCTGIDVPISRIWGEGEEKSPYEKANNSLANEINKALSEYWMGKVNVLRSVDPKNPFQGPDLANYQNLEVITLNNSIHEFPVTEGKCVFPCYGIESRWYKRGSQKDAPNPKRDEVIGSEKFYLFLPDDEKPTNNSQEQITIRHYKYFNANLMKRFDQDLSGFIYDPKHENPEIRKFIGIVKTAYTSLEIGSFANSTIDHDELFAEMKRNSSRIGPSFIVRSA